MQQYSISQAGNGLKLNGKTKLKANKLWNAQTSIHLYWYATHLLRKQSKIRHYGMIINCESYASLR